VWYDNETNRYHSFGRRIFGNLDGLGGGYYQYGQLPDGNIGIGGGACFFIDEYFSWANNCWEAHNPSEYSTNK